MFQRNSNISVAQFSSSNNNNNSEQVNDAEFQSATSSPSNFSSQLSSTNSMAKIIDIHKNRYSKRSNPHEEDCNQNRNAATSSTGNVSGSGRSNTLTSNQQEPTASASGNSRWSPGNITPQTQAQRATSQKQPSGETLSSFESDYDLLVYLGETETEDLVDTERSLDYQDQTWRQSICGASLAPTIDESLSELISHNNNNNPNQNQEFDLLNTPTPFGGNRTSGNSPFQVTPSPSRSLSSHQLNAPLASLNSQQRPSNSPYLNPSVSLKQPENNQRAKQLWQQVPSVSNQKLDECDSEVSLVFSGNNNNKYTRGANVPPNYSRNQKVVSQQTKGFIESDYANLPQVSSNNNSRQLNQIKASTMGRNQEPSGGGHDELDRLLAEMSQSLDLDALARYDTQPTSTSAAASQQQQKQQFRSSRPMVESSQTLGRYEQPDTGGYRVSTNKQQNEPFRSKSSIGQKVVESPAFERVHKVEGKQQQASSESILDEYDGASRMLEQMISDQLEESSLRKQPIVSSLKYRPQNQRADSLSQSIQSGDTGSRDSPKSVIANYNFPSRRPLQRGLTRGSSRSSKTSVGGAQHESSATGSPSRTTELGAGGSSRKVSSCSSSVATDAASVVMTPHKSLSTKQTGSQDIEPLEKRSIWRPAGRLVSNRIRGASESSDLTRKSVESTTGSQLLAKFEQKQKHPPPPPKVDYEAGSGGDRISLEAEVIRVEAADIPGESSDEKEVDEPIRVQESQMNRMKRRTLSSYRSMRNKISDFMTGNDNTNSKERSQTPAPPKRSSSIGSRSELPVKEVDPVPERPSRSMGQRESRSVKRRGDQVVEAKEQVAASNRKGSSFGQQIRERLSRSKSRLSKLLSPSKARRAQSQPGKATELADSKDEVLFQPGDLARNWTSVERDPLKSAIETVEKEKQSELVKKDDANIGITSPLSHASSNSSLSGLDISSSRSGRSSRRKQSQNKGSRPPSLISLKRLSASFGRPQTKDSKTKHDDQVDPLDDELNQLNNKGKLSKRAKRRRRRAAASGGQSTNSSGQDSSASSPKVAPKVPTTNDYFGQVAPPRVDSPDKRPSVGDNQKPIDISASRTKPASPEPSRPNRSQSLRNVRLMVPAHKPELDDSADDEATDRDHKRKVAAGHKRTVSFSNLSSNRRPLPSTTNTFRPASACAKLDVSADASGEASSINEPNEISLLVTPVGPSNSAIAIPTTTTTTTTTMNFAEQQKFKPIPPPFGQHQLHPTPSNPPRSKSAAMLDDIRYKWSNLFGSNSPNVRRKNTPTGSSPQPTRPPRKSTIRVRSKSAMATEAPTGSYEFDYDDDDDDDDNDEENDLKVIEAKAATPGSTLEHTAEGRLSAAGSGSGPKNRFSSLAQQLKHSANELFQGSNEAKKPVKKVQSVNTTTTTTTTSPNWDSTNTNEKVVTSVYEWKPVIAVRDAKLANRSAGRSIVTEMLNIGKDDGCEEEEEDEPIGEKAPNTITTKHRTLDRTSSGPSQIARFKSLQQQLKQQQQQQASLDTDSTWEESSSDEENRVHDLRVVQKDDSWRQKVEIEQKVALSSKNPALVASADEPLTSKAKDNNVGESSSNIGGRYADNSVRLTSSSNSRKAIDDKATSKGLTPTSFASKGNNKPLEELNNNNIQEATSINFDIDTNTTTSNNNNNNNNHTVELLKRAKRDFQEKEEEEKKSEAQQLLQLRANAVVAPSKQQQQQQQVVSLPVTTKFDELNGNSKKSLDSNRTDRRKEADDVELTRKEVEFPLTDVEQQQICKSPFKFNADLPSPLQLLKNNNNNSAQEASKQKASTLESPRSKIPKISQRINNLKISEQRKEEELSPSSNKEETMAAALARPSASSSTGTSRVMDEADARLLEALGHKRAASSSSSSSLNSQLKEAKTQQVTTTASGEEDEESQESKRLSIYENMPPPRAPLDLEQQKQKRGWRKPPWPPEKPAHLRKVQLDQSPPDSPSAWSVGEQADCNLPKLPADKLQELNRALREAERGTSVGGGGGGSGGKVEGESDIDTEEKPPAKPKRRLVTMTSIIQDPNDELMVADAAQANDNKPPGGEFRSFTRQDSSFSITNTDGNNSDSDSSFAAAAASRRRLVNKFENFNGSNKPPITAPKPKFPAFEDGKSALARGSPSEGNHQSSMVKRLAKTFDQTAQEASPQKSKLPPARGGPATSLNAGRSSFELDDPKSESLWFDAKSSEQLDEAEVAKFLAEFDNETRQSTVSEDVSTGADPFVTVAESTLEEPRQQQGDDDDDDDTLNDEVDDDLDDNNETFGDLGADVLVTPATSATINEEKQQGKELVSSLLISSLKDVSELEERSSVERSGDDKASGSEKINNPKGENNNNKSLSGGDSNPLSIDSGNIAHKNNNNNNNNNNKNESETVLVSSLPILIASNTNTNNNNNNNTPATEAEALDNATLTAADHKSSTAESTTPNSSNRTTDAHDDSVIDNDIDDDDDDDVGAISTKNPANATAIEPNTSTSNLLTPKTIDDNNISGAHLIDNKFKNSLNHIIARRSARILSPPPPLSIEYVMTTAKTSDEREDTKGLNQQLVKETNKNTKGAVKKDKFSDDSKKKQCQLISSKELKGLTRYYHALLGRKSRSKKTKSENTNKKDISEQQQQQPEQQNPKIISVGNGNNNEQALIDDCIHSSTSSSSSSSTCSSVSCSRSSSPVTSRSPSLATSCSSSPAQSDDENAEGGGGGDIKPRRRLRQMDDQKLMRDAKKCSRLYEELEKILARRMAKQWKHQAALKKSQTEAAAAAAISNNSELQQQDLRDSINSDDLPAPVAGGGANEDEELDQQHIERFYSGWSLVSTTSTAPDDQISLSSSSVSSESIPELKQRQNLQKLYHVVNEIHSSEAKFVDTLKLLNEDFRKHIQSTNSVTSNNPTTNECVSSILKHLPQLQALNENLLDELKQARDQWPRTRKIAHVLVKIGPFLKHYSTYIREFDQLQQQFVDCLKKYPQFAERVREFESSERSQKLTIQHHLLKPIQRIPQYRLLLQQYLHYLKPDDVDYEDTVNALEVVSRVAEHANQSMNEGANFAKLLALQAKIVGKQKDIIQPGRLFVKEGELLKVCRKQVQPRWFVLLNDALLYLTQIQSSDILYLNNELPLDDCLISTPSESKQSHNLIGKQFETEFSVCTKTRSFALIAKSREERDDWVLTFRKTIEEHLARRRSFSIRYQKQQLAAESINKSPNQHQQLYQTLPMTTNQQKQHQGHLLGQKAPLWTPDSRVSMCQLCTSSFSALFRRHHCRSCGRVVCSACSSNRAPLVYLKCRSARVCDHCFEQLKSNIHLYYLGGGGGNGHEQLALASNEQELRRLDEHFRTLLKSQFVRHAGLKGLKLSSSSLSTSSNKTSLQPFQENRQSGRGRGLVNDRLGANDSGSTISGYLHRRHQTKPKWKRQWFVIRNKVLYAYRAIDDVAAINSIPLLGFDVDQPNDSVDGLESKSLIRLRHLSDYARSSPPQLLTAQVLAPAQPSPSESSLKRKASKGKGDNEPAVIEHLFKAESVGAAERWLEAFRMSVVLDDGKPEEKEKEKEEEDEASSVTTL